MVGGRTASCCGKPATYGRGAEVRDTWLAAVELAATQLEKAILRERELGVAPPGCDARRIAEAITWQSERRHFRAWAELPGAMSKKQLCDACLESYMRMIFLADDPDPEAVSWPQLTSPITTTSLRGRWLSLHETRQRPDHFRKRF